MSSRQASHKSDRGSAGGEMRPIPLHRRCPGTRNRVHLLGTCVLALVIVAGFSLRGVAQSSESTIWVIPLSHRSSGLAENGSRSVAVGAVAPPGDNSTMPPPVSLAPSELFRPQAPAVAGPTHSSEETEHVTAPKQRFLLEVSWHNGLHLDSSDDQFHIHVGGNAQIDSTWL